MFCVGGGEGGYIEINPDGGSYNTGGHGGGGGFASTSSIDVSGISSLFIGIGSGGIPNNYNGGTTLINFPSGTVQQASGGSLGKGGSGGGFGGSFGAGHADGFNGGSDGSNGSGPFSGEHYMKPGQGTTTRAFGESDGTLYSGGGGGGAYYTGFVGIGGAGGGGNGGRGFTVDTLYADMNGISGSVNTGGGGGGMGDLGLISYPIVEGSSGGSGVAIIRW